MIDLDFFVLALAVKDDTFIVIVHRPGRSCSAPYSTHGELSAYCLALYDNWTIMGNRDQQLRFYADGVELTYYGTVGAWFPPGVKGPILTHVTLPTPHIAYDGFPIVSEKFFTLDMAVRSFWLSPFASRHNTKSFRNKEVSPFDIHKSRRTKPDTVFVLCIGLALRVEINPSQVSRYGTDGSRA